MRSVVLLLGDQLFQDISALPTDAPILMQEDLGLATRVRHHQQKITLVFSAMRHRAAELRDSGREVIYHLWDTDQPSVEQRLRHLDAKEIHTFEPHDRFYRDALKQQFGETLRLRPSPMFLTPEPFWRDYAKGKRRLMGDFYMRQRRRMGLLIEPDGQPTGGQWSFDELNRKRLPKNAQPPAISWVPPDSTTQAVIELVRAEFPNHPGDATGFCWPVTAAQAECWLNDFLNERLESFGPYEDSLSVHYTTLWHSLLTPMLNIGLLTPHQVVKSTLDFAAEHPVPVQSLEGFLRQIIGWREFIKKMDEEYGENGKDQLNFFGHERELGDAWATASTGLPPVDRAIRRAQAHGWCHHIDRLMVLGAVMLMSEIHPKESYRWFMENFIDSSEWVMAPNVFGMSQFSDGGTFATKPYLSGSAYILKMGDDARGEWCDIWDGLYWRFLRRHRPFFERNPRMSTLVRGLDRLAPARREHIFSLADAFIERTTRIS